MIFRKPKVEEAQPLPEENEPKAAQQHEQAPPPVTAGGETSASVLTADVVMEGNLVTSGELLLNGTVHGAVQASRIVVDVNGAVNGQVVAEEIIIRGRVIGPICGVRVHLQPGAQVEGDVMSHSIVVEDGAFIDGQIRHSDDPLGEWQQMWYGEEEAADNDLVEEQDTSAGISGGDEPEASYLRRADSGAQATAEEENSEDSDEKASPDAVARGENG